MIHDPDLLVRDARTTHHGHDAAAYNPDFLPDGDTSTTCCNCLLPYKLDPDLDRDRCPRCGANPAFAVPRHDGDRSGLGGHKSHMTGEVDHFGLTLLFVGMGLSLALTAFLGLTSAWATTLLLQFTPEPGETLVSGVRWAGFALSVLAALRAVSSVLAWRSGHYFYRRFRLNEPEEDGR